MNSEISQIFSECGEKMDEETFVNSFENSMANFSESDLRKLFQEIDITNKKFITFVEFISYFNEAKVETEEINLSILNEIKNLCNFCNQEYNQITYRLLLKTSVEQKQFFNYIKYIFHIFNTFRFNEDKEIDNVDEILRKFKLGSSIRASIRISLKKQNSDQIPKLFIDKILNAFTTSIKGINISPDLKTHLFSLIESIEKLKKTIEQSDLTKDNKFKELLDINESLNHKILKNDSKIEKIWKSNDNLNEEIKKEKEENKILKEKLKKQEDFEEKNTLLFTENKVLKNSLEKMKSKKKSAKKSFLQIKDENDKLIIVNNQLYNDNNFLENKLHKLEQKIEND